MKLQKLLLLGLVASTLSAPAFKTQSAQALELTNQNVGFIDVNYIIANSKKTQELKQKQETLAVELQKYGISEKEKTMNSKLSLSKQDMEKELISKISLKKETLEKQYKEDFILVQQKIKTSINQVKEQKHLVLVFTKDSLVSGGVDITNDVIQTLDLSK